MAVEKKSKETKRPEPQIRDYWKRYHRSAMITTTLMEILVTLVIGFALLVGGISPEKESFWITMFATLVTTTLLNYVIIDLLLRYGNHNISRPEANPSTRKSKH